MKSDGPSCGSLVGFMIAHLVVLALFVYSAMQSDATLRQSVMRNAEIITEARQLSDQNHELNMRMLRELRDHIAQESMAFGWDKPGTKR